jgi:hypothetical protein
MLVLVDEMTKQRSLGYAERAFMGEKSFNGEERTRSSWSRKLEINFTDSKKLG